MEKKYTEKELYGMIKDAMADNADVVAFCDKKIAQLVKKAENKKAKAVSETDAVLMEQVSAIITGLPTGKTVAEIINSLELPEDMDIPSTPKVVSILKKLNATKEVVKGKPYFKM